jgi:ribosomal protein S27E
MNTKRGHLKSCDSVECKYRMTTGKCAYGGWNVGHGCYEDWLAKRKEQQKEEDRKRPIVKILDIGYRKTTHMDKDVDKKQLTDISHWSNEFSRAAIRIVCPFCNNPVIAYIWSFSACGKRCDNCGAILVGGLSHEARRKNV